MPRGFAEHEKQLIRARLLDEGYRLFSAHGLKKTTVEELAAAAGISKGAYYLFYESKEAHFMDVLEEKAERRFRKDLLAAVEQPGPSPRARLLLVLQTGFAALRELSMLRFFTGSDFDVLMRRVPAEQLEKHLAGDREFLNELVARCQAAGIPIRVSAEEIAGLLYLIVMAAVHEDDWTLPGFGAGTDILLELIAAFSLGEITLERSRS